MAFEIDERVVVLESNRTRIAGVANLHGHVTGISHDESSGNIVAYGVLLDGRTRVHRCEPEDLVPENSRRNVT